MLYTLDLSKEELTILKNLLTLFPQLQGSTTEQKNIARDLLNYLNNIEIAKCIDPNKK